jgi:ribosomal-protein-alanine N-acetyltransferase
MAGILETIDIITDRLRLTRVTASDQKFIFELVNSKDWKAFIGDRNVNSVDEAKSYIEKILATKDFYYWVIRKKESGTPVGIASFLKRDYLSDFDIGFALLPEYYQQGYAFEATSALLTRCSNEGHRVILATVLPSNTKSIELLKKLNFQFDREIQNNTTPLQIFRWTNNTP